MATTLPEDMLASIRASATSLCWKRATDLPPSLRIQQGTFKSSVDANVALSYSAVFPPKETPLRGVVLFLHGINEHSERYFHVFESLCEMGFGAIAYDLRSHGKSHMDVPNLRAHVEKFDELINDTNDFVAFAKKEIYPAMTASTKLPLVIMGMSLGTLVSVLTVLSGKHQIDAMVLVAPAVSAEMTLVLRFMAMLSTVLATVAPQSRLVPGVNADWVSRDSLVTADFDADPLTTREPLTCLMAYETLGAMAKLQHNPRVEDASDPFCQIPIIMLMGTSDKVTSIPLAKQFYERIANKDKQFVDIQDAYHVLFEDFERPLVMDNIRTWLVERFPVQKSS